MSTETLAFFADTGQYGAAKIGAANKTRFIMRLIDAKVVDPRKIQTETLPSALTRIVATFLCRLQ